MSPADGFALHLIGCSHHSAPLEVREALALTPPQTEQLATALRAEPALRGHVLLHTCNRLEIYASANAPDTPERILEQLARTTGFPIEELRRHHYHRSGLPAIEHLFAVGSGLESQMVGETEILGQLKDAYRRALEGEYPDALLHRVFQRAFQAAKWVRTHTPITEGQTSIGNVAVELAQRIFGNLETSRCILLGTGEVGRDVAKAFASRGVRGMEICGRNPERVAELAGAVNAAILPFADWSESLHNADILICATAAPSALVSADQVKTAMRRRPARPLFLIDLAVPRDIESAAGDLDNVFLYLFADLAAIANENLRTRREAIDHCRSVLRERAERLWQNHSGA